METCKEDSILIYCKGDPACSNAITIPVDDMKPYLSSYGYRALPELRKGYTCGQCRAEFEALTSAVMSTEE